jgi:hypothetical protein
MNHLCGYRDKQILTIDEVIYLTIVLDGFLSSIKGSSLMNQSPPSLPFFDWVSQKMLPSPNASFQKGTMVLLMGFDPLESLLSKSMKHSSDQSCNCVGMRTPSITL